MKKIFALALCAAAFLGCAAQLAPTTEGMRLTYEDKHFGDESYNHTVTMTVRSVVTDNGTTTVTVDEHTETGTLKTVPDSYLTYIYTTPEAATTVRIMDADQFKEMMLANVRREIEDAGQQVSDADFAQLTAAVRPTGKLQLVIDPAAESGAKIPNSSMRLSLQMMTLAMHITAGKFLGTESVTTPAGTFDCVKISYTYKFNAGGESEQVNNTAWYAPGIGLVKEEGHNRRGDLIASEVLLQIEQ